MAERRAKVKRDKSKAASRQAYGRDVGVQWLGDEDDAAEADQDSLDDQEYRVWPLIPAGVDFYDFLVRMHWTDERVLDRQSIAWVFVNFQVYKFELLTGILMPPM